MRTYILVYLLDNKKPGVRQMHIFGATTAVEARRDADIFFRDKVKPVADDNGTHPEEYALAVCIPTDD